ncbi:MAG: pitrilysin family protein [Patescibacteria group bacterium]|jgi:predicted Zn-dependent peptidase
MGYKKEVLKNGLRLITVPLKDATTVTLLVLTKVGSRHEPPSVNGVSHFIEHLMFKGTTRRPTTRDISKELDAVGAEYNAFTGKDHTGYYIKIEANKLPMALDVLSDMLQHSKFDKAEIDRERGVIVEEINMYEDNPIMFIEDIFESTVFGKQHPLGQMIAGPRQVIRTVTRREILSYRDRHYHTRNMVVVMAGKIPPRSAQMITRAFNHLNIAKTHPAPATSLTKQTIPRLIIMSRTTEQIQLCLGFLALSMYDSNIYALALLSVILGGNMSSRLFINIREKRGLCYFIKASANGYEDTGTFVIQAGLDKSRLDQAVAAILDELKRVKDAVVTAEELKQAREYLRGRMLLDLEDTGHLASWYGQQEIFKKKILTPEERYRKLEAVTAGQIQRVANSIFRRSALSLALIGPGGNKAELLSTIKKSL